MESTCQRCHEPVRDGERYCPACGLPQLTYVAAEAPIFAADEGLPISDAALVVNGIAWRPALRAAMMLSIPAAVLCWALTELVRSPMLALVWMLGAAATAVTIYAKRARPNVLSMATGARIGLVTGLFTSCLALSVEALMLWAVRAAAHQGSVIDTAFATLSQQIQAPAGMSASQAAQTLQMRALVLSPEGRVGIALLGFAICGGLLVMFATIGGMVGARVAGYQRRHQA